MVRKQVFLGTTALFALAAVSSTALAQEGTQSGVLEEVVVTAQKRAENIQEIPKQVQVVGTELMRANNITTVNDLRKLVPSISGTGNSIRGVATSATTISANSKVGTVVDDIPIPSRSTSVNNLLDVERVEVLPGPQGTLAGRNATGGLINLVTRKPARDGYSSILQGTMTSDEEYIAGVYVTGPISDQVAFSLSSNYQFFKGLRKNIRDGQWDENENMNVRAKLLFAPSDDSELTATYAYYKEHTRLSANCRVYSYIGVPLTSITTPLDVQTPRRTYTELLSNPKIGPDSNECYSAFGARQHRINHQGILRYEKFLSFGTFTAVASVMRERAPQLQDTNAFTLVNMNIRPEYDGYAHVGNSTDYKTLEFRFASNTDQPLTYLFGAFFSDNNNGYDYTRYYQPVNWNRDFGQRNGAIYGSTSYTFSTGTTIRGGLRYEKDYIDYIWVFNPILATTKVSENGRVLSFPQQNALRVSTGKHSDDYVNYDFGIQQKLGEDIMFYGTYAKADQGPLYDAEDNTVAIVRDLDPVLSEKVKSFEIGMKSTWLDRRLIFNINYFDSKFDNYQASTNVPDPLNPLSVPILKLNSVGRVTTRGVEFTTAALLGGGFRVDMAGMYNEAKIKKWLGAPCYALQSAQYGCITSIVPGEFVARPNQPDMSGNQLASAPKWKLTVIPSYTGDLDSMASGLTYRVSSTIRYQSSYNTTLLMDPAKDVGSTIFVDAQISFQKGPYELMFFVNNLTKESAETFSYQLQPGMSNFARLPSGEWPIKTRDLDRNNNRYFGIRLKASY